MAYLITYGPSDKTKTETRVMPASAILLAFRLMEEGHCHVRVGEAGQMADVETFRATWLRSKTKERNGKGRR